MAINTKYSCYLIIYDIKSNKTRNNMSKLLEGYGIRVQKSCFELRIEEKVLKSLLDQLGELFSQGENIICYKIYANEIIRYNESFIADEDPVMIFI